MNILYITHDGITDTLGRSQILPYLLGLSACGHEITLVSSEKRNKQGERDSVGGRLRQAGIVWLPVNYPDSSGLLGKFLLFIRMQKAATTIIAAKGTDVVHCRSYLAALAGLSIKKKYGVKFIFDMRGFWADERVEGGIWNRKNPLYRLLYLYFKRKEMEFLKQADCIVSLTNKACEEIRTRPSMQAQQLRIEVIPCCVDVTLFDRAHVQVSGEQKKRELGIHPDSFVLGYVGSLGTWYMLKEMLYFYRILLARRPDAAFLFLTPESGKTVFDAARAANVPAGNIIVRYCDRDDLPAMMSLVVMSVFFIRPVYSKIASCPTRMAELLSMGIPFVCNSGIGDIGQIAGRNPGVKVIDKFTDEAYRACLEDLDQLVNTDKQKMRAAAIRYFSLEWAVQQYDRIVRSLYT